MRSRRGSRAMRAVLLAGVCATSPAWGVDAVDSAARPVPFTLGVGAGTVISGSSILAPNAASVRLVMSDELQLEPLINLALSGTPDAGGDTQTTTTLRAGGLLRYVWASNGPLDLQLLGGGLLAFISAENAQTLELSASYGASVVWYLNDHWSLSGDATNPVVAFTRVSPDEGDAASTYTIGAVWNPTVTAMMHIYF